MEKYTVLLVDDEPFILKSLVRLLRGEHVNILSAGNGQEALDIMSSASVQLVIADNLMPGITGVELIKKIKEHWPETIRIILSGQSDTAAVLQAVNQGEAFRFILKPWNDQDLQATVNIALAHYRLAEENRMMRSRLALQERVLSRLRESCPDQFDEASRAERKELESIS